MHGDEAVAYLAIEGSGLLHGSNVRKYYATAGERVAMRERGQLYWLIADHLGSTITVLDSTGAKVGDRRYTPFGSIRHTWNRTPTDRRFNGQIQEQALGGVDGLYFFNARFFDPALGRFTSPDTIIPDPYNPIA